MGKRAEDVALYKVKNAAKQKEAANRATIARLEAEKAIEHAKVGAEKHQRHMAEFATADTLAAAAGEAKQAAEKELEDTTEVSDKAARMSVLANKRAKAHTATYEEMADISEQEKATLELAMEEDAEAQQVLAVKKDEEAHELAAEEKVTALEVHTAEKSEETALAHESAIACAEASADKHKKIESAAGAVHKDAAKAVKVHAAHVKKVQQQADETLAQAASDVDEAATAAQEAVADTAEEEEAPLPDKLEGALQLAKIAQGEDELESQASESQASESQAAELESQAAQ
jgi:ParB family chromosome partitioning protein